MRESQRKPTGTSNFGVSRREAHDASAFYARFEAPELSDDETVAPRFDVVEPCIHGDIRERDDLPDNSVALVVTSPPYFAGKQYEEELGAGRRSRARTASTSSCSRRSSRRACASSSRAGESRSTSPTSAASRTARCRPTSSRSSRTASRCSSAARSSGRRARVPAATAPGARSSAPATPCCATSPSASSWRARGGSIGRSVRAGARGGSGSRTSFDLGRRLHGADARRVGDPAGERRPGRSPRTVPGRAAAVADRALHLRGRPRARPVPRIRFDARRRRRGSVGVASATTPTLSTSTWPERRLVTEVDRTAPARRAPSKSRRRSSRRCHDDALDFQARATQEGKAAKALAEQLLQRTGFQIHRRNVARAGDGRHGRLRGVRRRGRGAVLVRRVGGVLVQPGRPAADRHGVEGARVAPRCSTSTPTDAPVILLSSHLPKPGSEGDIALRASRRVDATIFDVVPHDSIPRGIAGCTPTHTGTASRCRDSGRRPSSLADMPGVVSIAILHGDPPHVIVAEDLDALHWRIALELVAQTPAVVPRRDRGGGDPGGPPRRAVGRRGRALGALHDAWMDVYESWDLHRAEEVELAPAELQFTPAVPRHLTCPTRRTTITELVTGLGMLGYDDVGAAVRGATRARW